MAEETKPTKSGGYGKRPLWQWIVLYIIVGGLIYFLIYYFFFNHGYNYNSSSGQNQNTPSYSY